MDKSFRELLAALCASIDTPEQCHEAFDAIKLKAGMLKASAVRTISRDMGVGARVQFEHKSRGIVRGTVLKINRTTVSVDGDDGFAWRVSAAALQPDDGKGANKGMSVVEVNNVLLPADPEACRRYLIGLAANQMVQYPQYKGKFEGYMLGRMRTDLRTKMGLAFRKGEMVIYDPKVERGYGGALNFSVWSMANKISTQIGADMFEPIATEEVARG